ncbi:MAG: hypothetical protein QOC73_53, partial [Actinomycetota bacterium]|nr:hypothetical protein [Actinomycetota bacterium]
QRHEIWSLLHDEVRKSQLAGYQRIKPDADDRSVA